MSPTAGTVNRLDEWALKPSVNPVSQATYVRETERVGHAVELRKLARNELDRVAEIDRTEHIDMLYDQHGTQLTTRRGDWNAPAWDPAGAGEHSVRAQLAALQHYADQGAIAIGAFRDGRLVGIGVVLTHLRPTTAQLAYLHVSAPMRAQGIGTQLADELDRIARAEGDLDMVVSATPSANTVCFYLSRGFMPMEEPLAELLALEPDDIHMRKLL